MRMLASKMILLTIPLALSACVGGNVETEWSCPADQPIGCYTVSDADKVSLNIIEREPVSTAPASIPNVADTANTDTASTASIADTASIANTAGIADTAGITNATGIANTDIVRSQRIEEELTAVWIGAFIDEDDNYHPASEIFIVVRPPKWKLQ